jgi:hypothetical protein
MPGGRSGGMPSLRSHQPSRELTPMPGPSSMDREGPREKARKTLVKSEFRSRRDRKEQGLSAGPIESVYTSRTKRPLAPDQVRSLQPRGHIDPFAVHTLQDTASSHFTPSSPSANDGRSIIGTAMELKRGRVKLPAIQVLREGGKVFTRDHRRLAAARRANVWIGYELTESNKAMKDAERKRSTKSGGTVLKLIPSEQVPYTEDESGSHN